jgi:hypothetical protein
MFKKQYFVFSILTVLSLVICVSKASAQTKKNIKKQAQNSPPKETYSKKGSIFTNEAGRDATVSNEIEHYNVLKTNLLSGLYGAFTLSYERVLTNRLSVEGMIGVTRPFLAWRKSTSYQTNPELDIEPFVSTQSASTDLTWGISGRYCFAQTDRFQKMPYGFSLVAGFEKRSYKYVGWMPNLEIRGVSITPHSAPATLIYTDLGRVLLSYQDINRFNVTWDLYVGCAYRQKTATGDYFDVINLVTKHDPRTFAAEPFLLIGAKLGYSF